MKKLLSAFLTLVIIFLSAAFVPSPVYAQAAPTATTPAPGTCDAWYLGNIQDCIGPALLKAATGTINKQAGDVGSATFAMAQLVISLMGMCDAQANPACPRNVSYQGSALAGLQNATIAMYQNPPAQTSIFIADIGNTLGFMPKKAQAQGIGFAGLSGLLELWKAFRNIAYALLAVILIVVGFMVMFRKKIDPKTVVTVQNAIPRIVIALLLVTFSYAIVGVMIDLMYLTIVLSVSVISNASPALGDAVGLFTKGTTSVTGELGNIKYVVGSPATTTEVTSVLFNGGVWGLFRFFMGSGFQAWDDVAALFTGGGQHVAGWIIVPGIIGGLAGGGKGLLLGLLSAPLALTLIILIVLLFGFIRLVFMLIDAYINIIISLLTAPFQLMMEAVPGTNAFNGWFRNLFSKIIVFPLTAVLLMVAAYLTSQQVSASIWAPPLISTGSGGFGMAGIIGLGMLLVIPSVVAGIQKGLKAEPLIPGGVGTILGPVMSGGGQLMTLGYQASFVASALRHKPETRSTFQIAKEGTEKGIGSITGGGGH